ncbi:putative adoMet-dependent methyltransferase domain-containing protein [Sarocladium implicatum]|nr:putative adoMet-dependent methyltransferase domain-containing protein [Sarocladium implicatum]
MVYTPEEAPLASPAPFQDATATGWEQLYQHACTFKPESFDRVMLNLIRNPNINSSWLFRADVLHDSAETGVKEDEARPVIHDIADIPLRRTLVRKLIPRNTSRDAPLDQTCTFHRAEAEDGTIKSLVLYVPHCSTAEELPFYHPKVNAIAHYHEWDPATESGHISVSFLPYKQPGAPDLSGNKLRRVAYHLLEVLHKHGHSTELGYVKRVHHDILVPQSRVQDRYQKLKDKYARNLCSSWAETTDPVKHVFEDLSIAAFLMELWADTYKDREFPGFVDIGCGNGLLVHLLVKEGYRGWGFDARSRKSWEQYNTPSSASPSGLALEQRLLLPKVVPGSSDPDNTPTLDPQTIHDGTFPRDTFIISNHADELTPWTPILAAISGCPFIMIPCCSHRLTGERFRPKPPRDKSKSQSTYASLVDWVSQITEACGWELETEMLRIPSTRNTGLLGRRRMKELGEEDIEEVIKSFDGVDGYYENVVKLVGSAPRAH